MQRKLITLLLSSVLVLTPATLAGCGAAAQGSGENVSGQKVVLNEVAHSVFYAPMYVAIEEGYFAKEGLELELVTGFGDILE